MAKRSDCYAWTVTEPPMTRREITRQRTLDEIRQLANEQVREGGVEAISLNAIAKAMGMSGPAIYRYFASRNELRADLVAHGYAELGASMGEALGAVADKGPGEQLLAVTRAYRAWAIGNPHRFSMFYAVRMDDFGDLDEAIDQGQQSMNVILYLLAQIAAEGKPAKGRRKDELDRQLLRWKELRNVPEAYPAHILRLGILTWTRLHGVVTLELAGAFADMEIDAGLVCDAEIESVIAAARSGSNA